MKQITENKTKSSQTKKRVFKNETYRDEGDIDGNFINHSR